jgi:hypothetical protein
VSCSECGSDTIAAPVHSDLRRYLPDDRAGVVLCTRCLHVDPVDDPPAEIPNFQRVSTAFPADPELALPVVLILALLDSLALYRSELDEMAEIAEIRGVDTLLVLNRIADDPAIDPGIDLERRQQQLAQLLS